MAKEEVEKAAVEKKATDDKFAEEKAAVLKQRILCEELKIKAIDMGKDPNKDPVVVEARKVYGTKYNELCEKIAESRTPARPSLLLAMVPDVVKENPIRSGAFLAFGNWFAGIAVAVFPIGTAIAIGFWLAQALVAGYGAYKEYKPHKEAADRQLVMAREEVGEYVEKNPQLQELRDNVTPQAAAKKELDAKKQQKEESVVEVLGQVKDPLEVKSKVEEMTQRIKQARESERIKEREGITKIYDEIEKKKLEVTLLERGKPNKLSVAQLKMAELQLKVLHTIAIYQESSSQIKEKIHESRLKHAEMKSQTPVVTADVDKIMGDIQKLEQDDKDLLETHDEVLNGLDNQMNTVRKEIEELEPLAEGYEALPQDEEEKWQTEPLLPTPTPPLNDTSFFDEPLPLPSAASENRVEPPGDILDDLFGKTPDVATTAPPSFATKEELIASSADPGSYKSDVEYFTSLIERKKMELECQTELLVSAPTDAYSEKYRPIVAHTRGELELLTAELALAKAQPKGNSVAIETAKDHVAVAKEALKKLSLPSQSRDQSPKLSQHASLQPAPSTSASETDPAKNSTKAW